MHGNRLDQQRLPSSFSTHAVAIALSDAGVPYAEDDFPTKRTETKRTETMSPETSPTVDEAPSRSIRKRIIAVLLVIFLLVLLAPTIIAKTGLRDRLINAAIADDSLNASTQSASLGYLVPLSVQGFDLRADDGSLRVEMDSMKCEKSWLMMLFSNGELGTFRFRQPTLRVVTGIQSDDANLEDDGRIETDEDSDKAAEPSPIKSIPTLIADVEDARVQIRNASRTEPAIDLQGVNFTIRSEQSDFGSIVEIDPTTILDEQPLTPELCNQGVQLVAPMLADALSVQGSVSFRLDHCSIPVGDLDKQQRLMHTDIDGTLRLSDVSVSLNNQITAVLTSLLKRFGRVDDDIQLTVSRSSEVRFRVVEGRVHHQGLMFLLPVGGADFELNSSGSVGFDDSLDLELALGLPDSLLGGGPIAKFLTSNPIVIQVVGSVSEPQVQLASDNGWQNRLQSMLDAIGSGVDEASDSLNSDANDTNDPNEETQNSSESAIETAGTVLDIFGDLLNRGTAREEQSAPTLRDRIRNRGDQESSPPRRPGLLRRRRQQE
ncbi:MAG: hypothetical protein GY904_24535 [Planctomycetaceae bacterium]|nr:hypothetical protein [Planctomycetaceae bacterium]